MKMKTWIVLLLTLLAISCTKEKYNIVNLNGNKITVLGHGGMGIGHTYPMNSYESIAYALNLGADGVEIDIDMTKDSVLVAFHDLELSDRTNASGALYTKTWDDISEVTYKDPLYKGYKLLKMDHLFSGLGNQSNKLFILDCKNYNEDTGANYRYSFCRAVLKLIDTYQLQDNVILEFKRIELIKTMKELRQDIKILIYAEYDYGLMMAQQHQLEGIVISVDAISKEQVALAHNKQLMVAVLNAHSAKRNIDAIKKHVDIIQTDKLQHLLRTLK